MKKSVIWILSSIMAIAFFGLLWMQVTYFTTTMETRRDQFDGAVTNSLYQVSKNLEIDETKKYLKEEIEQANKKYKKELISTELEYKKHLQQQQYEFTESARKEHWSPNGEFLGTEQSFVTQTVKLKPGKIKQLDFLKPSRSENSISKASFEMQEVVKRRYEYQRQILDDVIYNLINVPTTRPIEERIDFKALHKNIADELKNNGVNESLFFLEIVKYKTDEPVFREKGYDPSSPYRKYGHILFINDPIDKLIFLQVYFPNREEHLYSEVAFMIPSVIFTFVLLTTYIIAIYFILRQKRLSEMKSDFMNNMTHELKTPASTISLAAQMLRDTSIDKSPQVFKHISGVINDETKRLSFRVEKVLQMSLFEKHQVTLNFKEIDVNDIIVNVANTFQLKVEQFGGELDIDLQAEASLVRVDEMHFTNVLFNLLDNAVKYRKEDVEQKLMIRTWNNSNNSKVFISVEDNGIGIKKEHLKKIFDRFYRISTGNRHDVKGFGLGLAYVKKIVLDLNGTIKAESEQGKGTKLIISMPQRSKN